jgi:hypothetical protein
VNILKSSHKQVDLLLASEAQLLKKKKKYVVAVAGWLTLYVCRIFFTVITGPPSALHWIQIAKFSVSLILSSNSKEKPG